MVILFISTGAFKWIDPKEFSLSRFGSNNSKGCVVEVDLEYPKKYVNHAIVILWLQIKYESKKKCCLVMN